MDKRTLTHYGWIAVVSLILAIMLAFASPFGTYIGDAVVSIARGFFISQDSALDKDNIDGKGDKFDTEFNKVQADLYEGDNCEHKNTVLQNVVQATCGKEGYSGDYYCNDCKKIAIYGQATPTTEHQNIEIQNAIKGSCSTKSFSGNKVCLDCNTVIEKGTYSKNNAHTPEYVGHGLLHTRCSTCNATLSEEHEFTKTIESTATCSTLGKTKYSCICGYTYTDADIPLVEHRATYGGVKPVHEKCIWCNKTLSGTHTYTSNDGEATCLKEGVRKYTCVCGYSYEEQGVGVNPYNHEGEIVQGGTVVAHSIWNCCGKIESATHQYTIVPITEATCETDGSYRYVCGCGYTKIEDVEALGHDLQAKYLNVDYVAQYDCSRCEASMIPQGATYFVQPTSTTLGSFTGAKQSLVGDNATVEFPSIVNAGDTYVYEGYEYRYQMEYDGNNNIWVSSPYNGWGVRVRDGSALKYSKILKSIAGKNLESMRATFMQCGNLIFTTDVPDTVKSMQQTYYLCSSLTDRDLIESIPNSVINMKSTFNGCIVLTTTPTLPNNITSLDSTFRGCASLITAPIIPNTVIDMYDTFRGCENLKTYVGNQDDLRDFSDYKLPDNLSSLNGTFSECKNLQTAPIFPTNLTMAKDAFNGCTMLEGIVIINGCENLYVVDECFAHTRNENSSNIIALMGDCPHLDQLALTDYYSDYLIYDNVRVVVDNPMPDGSTYSLGIENSDETYGGIQQTNYGLDIIYQGDGLTVPWPRNGQPAQYDMFTYGEYKYTYDCYYDDMLGTLRDEFIGYESSRRYHWSAHVLDNTKSHYGKAESYINGVIVDGGRNMFFNCIYITTTPELPETLWSLQDAFYYCSSLQTVLPISDSVVEMSGTFAYCTSLKEIPNFPNNLQGLYRTFYNCSSLESIPKLPSSCNSFGEAFENCVSLRGDIEITCDSIFIIEGTNIRFCAYAFRGTVQRINLYGNCNIDDLRLLAATDDYTDFSDRDNVRVLADNLIPEGAIYYVQPTSTKLNTCENGYAQKLVGDGKTVYYPTPQRGDALVYGDYEYRYQQVCNVWAWAEESDGLYNYWQNEPAGNSVIEALSGWGVRARDNQKTSYSATLSVIAEKPLTNMDMIFEDCYNLTSLSSDFTIPETVVSVYEMFDQCYVLREVPHNIVLHNKIANTHGMFWECHSLSKIHDNFIIPESVKYMDMMFAECAPLSGIITINATPTVYDGCFSDTQNEIYLTGSSNNLTLIAATDTDSYDNVHSLLHNDNKIPEGAVYYRGIPAYNSDSSPDRAPQINVNSSATTVLTAGSNFPDTPQTGDRYVYNGYEYAYNCYAWNGYGGVDTSRIHYWVADTSLNGWGVKALNNTATSYDMSVIEINNAPIKSFISTFEDFYNMTQLSQYFFVPNTIKSTKQMFDECLSLTSIPSGFYIPDSVVEANGTFWECSALTSMPNTFYVGNGVDDIRNIFSLCYNLSGSIRINGTPTQYTDALKQTKVTSITGSCNATTKQNILATK